MLSKGSVSWDFRPQFFHDSNPSRPLINRLKYFRIMFEFLKSSTVCIPPRSQVIKIFWKTLGCASHCWVWLRGVDHTAESDFAGCFSQWIKTPRCASHRWVKLHGVHHTAKSDSAVCIPPPSQYLPSVVLIQSFTNAISLWCLKTLLLIFDHKHWKFDSAVCITPQSQNLSLSKSKKFS